MFKKKIISTTQIFLKSGKDVEFFFPPKYCWWLFRNTCFLNACIWALQKFFPEQVHPGVMRCCVRARESRITTHIICGQHWVLSHPHLHAQVLWCRISGESRSCLGCASEERVCSHSTRISAWVVLSMKCPNSAETALPVGCHPAMAFWSVSALQPHSEFWWCCWRAALCTALQLHESFWELGFSDPCRTDSHWLAPYRPHTHLCSGAPLPQPCKAKRGWSEPQTLVWHWANPLATLSITWKPEIIPPSSPTECYW